MPSSIATRAASAVASFVTEAQRKTCSAGPCSATTPSGRDDRRRGVRRAPVVDLAKGVHGGGY